MNTQQAHEKVLEIASKYTSNVDEENAVMLTRRDLLELDRKRIKEDQRRKSENSHDDITLTIAQVKALFNKWTTRSLKDVDQTFPQFLDGVQATLAMDNAVTVPWCGMWLAIETDGYTHS